MWRMENVQQFGGLWAELEGLEERCNDMAEV